MNENMKILVGMSGGVDSSLTAALLVEQGYDVTGVYMKNWTTNLPGVKCPWADDLSDAKRVAVQLGIDFKVFDFENEYKHKVVDYMIDEYKSGRTPNPDVMCNQEIKFKLFLEAALEDGADAIATGHYARVANAFAPKPWQAVEGEDGLETTPRKGDGDAGVLLQAVDRNKDQTYFLYRVTGEALGKTLFPIGELTKPQVRRMAGERGLSTATKKDSQGICFVGQVGIRDFLTQYVDQEPGVIKDAGSGTVLGPHEGAIFYTLGQRHGLGLGGGLPYYVVGKDMEKNEVYVTTDLDDAALWGDVIRLGDVHWINETPADGTYLIRGHHRAPLLRASLETNGADAVLRLDGLERSVASGQSVVIYDGDVCLGGGIVI